MKRGATETKLSRTIVFPEFELVLPSLISCPVIVVIKREKVQAACTNNIILQTFLFLAAPFAVALSNELFEIENNERR